MMRRPRNPKRRVASSVTLARHLLKRLDAGILINRKESPVGQKIAKRSPAPKALRPLTLPPPPDQEEL